MVPKDWEETYLTKAFENEILKRNLSCFGQEQEHIKQRLKKYIYRYQTNTCQTNPRNEINFPFEVACTVSSFCCRSDSISMAASSKILCTFFFPVKQIVTKYLSVSCWNQIDEYIQDVNDVDCDVNLYDLYKGINTCRRDDKVETHTSISSLLCKRYYTCLKPVLFLQVFIFKVEILKSMLFLISKKKKKRCSFGKGNCQLGNVAILVKTSKGNQTNYNARFFFCDYHLRKLKNNYNLFY